MGLAVRRLRCHLGLIFCLGLVDCTSTQKLGGSYELDGARFAIGALSPIWGRRETERGLAFALREEDGTVITVNATCSEPADAPLSVLTNHLLIGMTERAFEAREIVPFDGREAERTTLTAKLDGVSIRLSTMVLKKDWCVYDAVYAAAPSKFDAHLADFEALLAGFRTLGRR